MWVGIIIALVIISLLLWQIITLNKEESRIHTYVIWFKEVGYVAYHDNKLVEGKNVLEAFRSLGKYNPISVENWHDAKYMVEEVNGKTVLIGYFR